MNATATTHHVNATRYWTTGYFTANAVFIWGDRTRMTFGFSPEGEPCRWVQHGPHETALRGAFQLDAIVIANTPIIDPRPVIRLAVGDVIDTGLGEFVVGEPDRWNRDRPTATPK